MINIEGIVLHKLMQEQSLEAFADLKSCFFSEAYNPIYRIIHKFYMKNGGVPSFEELKLVTKNALHLNALQSLEILEVPDVELNLAVTALIDEYAQSEALQLIDEFVNKITLLDVTEIKDGIGEILLDLDSKLNTDEAIMTADQFTIFERPEETNLLRVPSGISNWFDAEIGGLYLEELLLLGGKRGSGKSIVCANLAAAQYEAGNVTVYYTIEMTGRETVMRIMCVLAKVNFNRYRKGQLTVEDVIKLAVVRSGMFLDGQKYLDSFYKHKDRYRLEKELKDNCIIKPDNQIIIVDDRELSITQLDLSLQKFKALHGDRLKHIQVDYLNQVVLGGSAEGMYDWKDQTAVSKQMKNLARKHLISIVSPYQIDDSGATRFSKGILDACDMAILLDSKKYPGSILYECTKARNDSDTFKYRTEIDWECLRICPTEVETDIPEEAEGGEGTYTTTPKKTYNQKAILEGEDDL